MEYERPSKDEYFLMMARLVATRSTCLKRHYGAVIVKDDRVVSTGYNGRPAGDRNCTDFEGFVCPRENIDHNKGDYSECGAVHAEQNAMLYASREEMNGATLYLNGDEWNEHAQDYMPIEDVMPCPICAAMIRNSGITRVVSPTDEMTCMAYGRGTNCWHRVNGKRQR